MILRSFSSRPVKYSQVPNAYDPKIVERDWLAWWETFNHFNNDKPTKLVCLPPPNVTGNLHIGHSLTVAIEDAVVRWYANFIVAQIKLTRIIKTGGECVGII